MIDNCTEMSGQFRWDMTTLPYLVQTWLSIEQYNVTIYDMSLDDIAYSQTVSNGYSITELEVLLETATSCGNVIGTRVNIATIPNGLFQQVDVMRRHSFGVS